jgi:hypothetical protein
LQGFRVLSVADESNHLELWYLLLDSEDESIPYKSGGAKDEEGEHFEDLVVPNEGNAPSSKEPFVPQLSHGLTSSRLLLLGFIEKSSTT